MVDDPDPYAGWPEPPPHEKPRLMQAALRPFCTALRAYRKKNGITQEEMAETLRLSRKTYIFFEQACWLPPPREVSHVVKRLHDRDASLALAFVQTRGERLEDHVLIRPSRLKASEVSLEAAQAKVAFDTAVYETAEDLDMSPKAVRPIAAALLGKLAAAGVTLGQAAGLAKSAAGKKTSA